MLTNTHTYTLTHERICLQTPLKSVCRTRIFGASLPIFQAIREVLLAGDTNRCLEILQEVDRPFAFFRDAYRIHWQNMQHHDYKILYCVVTMNKIYICVFQERFEFFLSANMQMSWNRSVPDRGLVAELTFVRLNDLAAPPEPVHLATRKGEEKVRKHAFGKK